MFQSIKNAFKTKEIRDKILFTLAMVAVIRLGTAIPIPGMDLANYQAWYNNLAGGEGGTLVLGGRDFTSTGSVAVTSGTLVLSNATWKAASEVWLTGGTLSIDQSDSFGKGRAPLYVKDGMLQVPADTYNYFSEAYLWDEGQGAYVRTGNGVFTAGATGLSAHLSGAGKVRVGKLGAMFTIR